MLSKLYHSHAHLLQYLLYAVLLGIITVYSYALVDPNITLLNHPLWEVFRNTMVQLGYHNRQTSWSIYLGLIMALYAFHYLFMKDKKVNALRLSIIIGSILLLSYPFLSHDIFNYMFDARILTKYGMNPYSHKAVEFMSDPWLQFLHWTHRTYPYGPVFLPITIAVSFFTFGKFLLNFIFFKALSVIFYIAGTYVLGKMKKEWAVFYATNPLILVEGIINGHNDLIAVSLGLFGVYYLAKKDRLNAKARLFFILSAGIKYITAPIIILQKNRENIQMNNILAFTGMLGLVLYLSVASEIQPWYYLNFFIFIPYFFTSIKKFSLFSFGLLVSYYPFIALGGWGKVEHVELKHTIIMISLIIQLVVLLPQITRYIIAIRKSNTK